MIDLHEVSFTYGNGRSGVFDVDLHIGKGELVLLCGLSGCGKSTLARLITGLAPTEYAGKLRGSVMVGGVEATELVRSSADGAFAPESNKVDKNATPSALLVSAVGAAKDAEIVVLDEPSANLDAAHIRALQRAIFRWKQEGKTIVVAEHRIFYLADLCDRVVYMADGRIVWDMPGETFRAFSQSDISRMGLRCKQLRGMKRRRRVVNLTPEELEAGLSQENEGIVVALVGENGSGKSTFARMLCGIDQDDSREVTMDGENLNAEQRAAVCHMVAQPVYGQLCADTVLQEVMSGQPDPDEERALDILGRLDLVHCKDSHPALLSTGQRQRLAIASAIAEDRKFTVYDEPTNGLDYVHMKEFAGIMDSLRAKGKTQIVVTHDPELILTCCDYVLHMERGELQEGYPLDDEGTQRMLSYFIEE